MSKEGWIKLHRSCLDHWLYTEYRPLTRREAWETILFTVNFDDSKCLIKGQLYDCNRGQSLLSLQSWAEKFVWSVQQVRTFFKLLEQDEMILVEGLQYTTRLTVCNYDTYQGNSTDQQHAANKRPTNGQQTANKPLTTIKEREEYKEEEERKEISIEDRSKLIDDILLFFCFKPGEPKSIPHQREINRFLTEIIKEGLFEVFTDQYQNFKKVKAENPKFNYSLKNFLFSDIGDASGGQWNAFDWGLKIKELKTSDLVPEGAKSRIEEIKQMIKRNETKL